MGDLKPILMAGVAIVNLALVFYTVFIIFEHKYKKAVSKVVFFITIGVIFDIAATACMIIGSENSPFSPHGILGYSSLTAMFVDAVLIHKHKATHGPDTPFPGWLNSYSKIAYVWWVLAYITGAALVATAK